MDELFHILSENTEMDFNEEDIGYDKRGVSITGYTKQEDKETDKRGRTIINGR